MRIPAISALALCFGAALPAASQVSARTLEPGARVRVSVPARSNGQIVEGTGRWVTGRLVLLDASSISLRVDGQTQEGEYTVPFDVLERLEVSRGGQTRGDGQRRGIVRGAIVGGAVAEMALLFGRLTAGPVHEGEPCTAECEFIGMTPGHVFRNGAIAAAGGALLGCLLGGRSQERWDPVQHPRLGLVVGNASLAIQLPLQP